MYKRMGEYNRKLENRRIKWIDNGKAIAVILVGLGHFNCSSIVVKWIYTFHIPLFLFLSGITLGTKNSFKVFLGKRIKSLIIPYVTYSLLLDIFTKIVMHKTEFWKYLDALSLLKRIFINWRGVYSPYYWYIPALFVAEILIFLIIKNINKLSYKIAIWVGIVALQYLKCSVIGVYMLPWDIDIVLELGQFILLGNIIWNSFKVYFEKYILQSNIFVLFIMFIGNLFIGMNNGKVDLYFGCVGNYIKYIVAAYLGIFMVCNISYKLRKTFIQYIGQNSLYFYILQEFTFVVANKMLFFIDLSIVVFKYIHTIMVNAVGEALIWGILKGKDKLIRLKEETNEKAI